MALFNKTGSLSPGTTASGVAQYTAAETGSFRVGVFLAGFKGTTVTPAKTGSLTVGRLTSGADSTTHVETGSIRSNTQLSGASSKSTILPNVYAKTGSLTTRTQFNGIRTGGNSAIPSRPVVSAVADELYEILKPLAYNDEALGWPLLRYCEAVSNPVQVVKDYGPDWSVILDVDKAPTIGLPWLAQLVGSTITIPTTDPAYDTKARNFIRAAPGHNRGTVAAIIASVQPYLTGTKTVLVRERLGGAYKLSIRTKTAETTSTALVLQAILSQKPAGITLDYATLVGQDYLNLKNTSATYLIAKNKYATYNGVYLDIAGA